MSSEQRIAASRANGKKSQGPVTPEGKRVSSRNAERHGLLSGSIVLEGEDEERFSAMLARFISEYCPQTDSEMILVEDMAVSKWRQKRVWGMETVLISEEIRNQAVHPELAARDAVVRAALAFESIVGRTPSLNLLNRYEARFDRMFIRARRELRESRAEDYRIAKRT